MPDDQDTPPRRPRRLQTANERDLETERRLRAERQQARTDRGQVDDLADAVDDGTVTQPVDREWGDVTKPHDVHELGPLTAREQELWERVDRLKLEVRRGRRDTADRITDAMGKRPPNERLTSLETRIKILWAILAAVGSLALGAAVEVAKGLYERGETDGQHEIRLQQVERSTERNAQRLEQLEHDRYRRGDRGSNDQPDHPAQLLAPKGSQLP